MELVDEAEIESCCKKVGDDEDHVIKENGVCDELGGNDNGGEGGEEESKWWDSESQYLLDSQQLVEGLSLCDEFLQSQSPQRDAENRESKGKPSLGDYAQLGPENLKKDLEECQGLALKKDLEECQGLAFDPANLELDTPPDFRLSQLVSFYPTWLIYLLKQLAYQPTTSLSISFITHRLAYWQSFSLSTNNWLISMLFVSQHLAFEQTTNLSTTSYLLLALLAY